MYRIVEALGGPILAWECKRAARGYLRKFFWLGYSAWLLLLAFAVFHATRPAFANAPDPAGSNLDHLGARQAQLMLFLDTYLALVLQFQLKLVLAITPA